MNKLEVTELKKSSWSKKVNSIKLWAIKKIVVVPWDGPNEYYIGGDIIQADQPNPSLEFRYTQTVDEAALWKSKEDAENVAKDMSGGKAYYWEACEVTIIDLETADE